MKSWIRSCVSLAMLGGVLVFAGTPTSAAAAAGPSLTASPSRPMAGERVSLAYRLPTKFSRTVSLQRWTGSTWKKVSKHRTKPTGRGTASVAARGSTTKYRVVATPVKHSGRSYAKVVSKTRRVAVVQQSVRLTLGQNLVTGAVTASMVAVPARKGRGGQLQERVGTAWRTIASATQRSDGQAAFPAVHAGGAGAGRTYRVVLSGYKGASGAASAPQNFTSSEMTVAVAAPSSGATVGETVSLTAVTSGYVSSVRFFIDGSPVGEDRSPPWSVPWTVERGEHDVTARAIRPGSSRLSASVVFNQPGADVDGATGIPQGFGLDPVQEGLDLPTSFAITESGRVFVSEKAGVIKTFVPDESGGFTAPETVVDISDQVLQDQDRGMTGIAVDPRFDEDDGHTWVYASYVLRDGNGDRFEQAQQVQRFDVGGVVDGDVLGFDADNIVVGRSTGTDCYDNVTTDDCIPLRGFSHTIGDLEFDLDGNLLVGIGDGALYYAEKGLSGRPEALRSQDPRVLAGKVLRVDPDTGRGVPGNKWYSGAGTSNASRVLALGLRNPFRLTVRSDGRIVVGEVGEAAWEELDVIDPRALGSANFGWPCLEGDGATDVPVQITPWTVCSDVRDASSADKLIPPAHAYQHVNGGSVTGGVFYEGQAYPAEFTGSYFFGDYAQNFIRTARFDEQGQVKSVAPFAYQAAAGGPVKFAVGPDGLLWFLSIYTGTLQRLTYGTGAGAAGCGIGSFRTSFFDLSGDDSSLAKQPGDYGEGNDWYRYALATFPAQPVATDSSCSAGISLAPTQDRLHPAVGPDRTGVRWQGRIRLDAGSYRFNVTGREWMRLWVDDVLVSNWFAYGWWQNTQVDLTLAAGLHNVRAELVRDTGEAFVGVTWDRLGALPQVDVKLPRNGDVIAGGIAGYEVEARAGEGGSGLASVSVVADLMHVTGSHFHAHPHAQHDYAATRLDGRDSLTGTFSLDENHAAGQTVYRIRARATDVRGAVTTSAPVYVCLPGNEVGICAVR